jgi:1-acyl-sn-glycerol-3-phosphate acyltransferase
MSSQFKLLGERRFQPFFLTQFAGAMNDNVFKIAFTGLVTYQGAAWSSMSPLLMVNLIAALFILPFILFSATAGQMADKYEKSSIMRWVKIAEVGIMLLAALGFIFHLAWLLLLCVFFMGLHSTVFGPVKFAYLPAHLKLSELVGGNALVESGTFIAILLGTIVAGLLATLPTTYAAAAVVALALFGYWVSRRIPETPAADPALVVNWNPFTETWRNIKLAHSNIVVFRSLLGISWLWFFGAVFLTQFAPFAKDVLHGDAGVYTLLLTVFSIGLALGSLLCERLSGNKIEIGLVPLGSIGMTVFAIDLYFACNNYTGADSASQTLMGVAGYLAHGGSTRILIDLFLLAVFGGLYSVPLYALIQTRCEPAYRSRIIAANNILNALFMIISAAMAVALFSFGATIAQVFLVTGILNALVAIYIYSVTPEFLMRFFSWAIVHTFYRTKRVGLEHLPATGAAVVIANHVSYADAVVMSAYSPRPIRFVMDHRIFKVPILGFIFRHSKAIPIAPSKENAALKEAAFLEVQKALDEGDIVGLFPEGALTSTGEMGVFRPGLERILSDRAVPLYATALRGLWGGFLSRSNEGKAFTTWRGIRSPIEWVISPAQHAPYPSMDALAAQVKGLRGEMK